MRGPPLFLDVGSVLQRLYAANQLWGEIVIDRHEYGRNDRRELHTQIRLSRP